MGSIIRTTRLNVSSAQVRHLQPRAVSRLNMPGQDVPSKLKMSAFVFHVWNLATPTDYASIATNSFVRGYNWATWKAALTARIVARGGNPATEIVEDNPTNTVYFVGEAFFDLCSMVHQAIVRIGTPTDHMNQIRSRSRTAVRVIQGFLNIESIGMCHGYTTLEDSLQNTMRSAVLAPDPASGCTKGALSPTVNGWASFGCNVIDKYEHSFSGDITSGIGTCSAVFRANAVACPHTPAHSSLPAYSFKPGEGVVSGKHTFDIDLRTANMGDMIEVLADEGGPTALGANGVLLDNVLEDPYKGSALPSYPASYTSAAYRAAYRSILLGLRSYFTDDYYLWGNAPETVNVYDATHVKNRFLEFAFRVLSSPSIAKTEAQMQAMLSAMHTAGCRVVLGIIKDSPVATNAWATSTGPGGSVGTWTSLAAFLRALGYTNDCYVQVARSTAGGFIYWQPEFEDLA